MKSTKSKNNKLHSEVRPKKFFKRKPKKEMTVDEIIRKLKKLPFST